MWPCFVCGSQEPCFHRERELVTWWYGELRNDDERRAAIARLIPTTAPERKPPAREGGEQSEMFGVRRWAV